MFLVGFMRIFSDDSDTFETIPIRNKSMVVWSKIRNARLERLFQVSYTKVISNATISNKILNRKNQIVTYEPPVQPSKRVVKLIMGAK